MGIDVRLLFAVLLLILIPCSCNSERISRETQASAEEGSENTVEGDIDIAGIMDDEGTEEVEDQVAPQYTPESYDAAEELYSRYSGKTQLIPFEIYENVFEYARFSNINIIALQISESMKYYIDDEPFEIPSELQGQIAWEPIQSEREPRDRNDAFGMHGFTLNATGDFESMKYFIEYTKKMEFEGPMHPWTAFTIAGLQICGEPGFGIASLSRPDIRSPGVNSTINMDMGMQEIKPQLIQTDEMIIKDRKRTGIIADLGYDEPVSWIQVVLNEIERQIPESVCIDYLSIHSTYREWEVHGYCPGNIGEETLLEAFSESEIFLDIRCEVEELESPPRPESHPGFQGDAGENEFTISGEIDSIIIERWVDWVSMPAYDPDDCGVKAYGGGSGGGTGLGM